MKTASLIFMPALCMLLSCSSGTIPTDRYPQESGPSPDEMKALAESLRADSVAKAKALSGPCVGKTCLVGHWKGTYSEYAYNIKVDLDIRPLAAKDEYQFIWNQQDQFGAQRQTYTLAMKYEGDRLIGKGKLHVDGTEVFIFIDDPTVPAIFVGVIYQGSKDLWSLTFTR